MPLIIGGCNAFAEGFGLGPLEAMACGATVLVANVASLPEVVGNGGLLLPPDDVEAWAHAMAMVLDRGPDEDQQVRALGQASTFSWDRAAKETLATLHRAASEGHARAGYDASSFCSP